MKSLVFISLIFLYNLASYSQSVGINEDRSAPQPSALLDVKSNAKGVLIPRMSTSQRNAIAGPAAGLLVFDLDKSTIYLFDGQKWQAMLFSGSDAGNPPISRSASSDSAGDKLGNSVSISGDYAIVGSYLDDIGTKADQGAAYIFARQGGTWSEQAKLTASDGAAGDNFGNSVSISGDYAIVGAPRGAGTWFLQGAVYIFTRNGTSWVQQAKLNASDGLIGDYFGTSVSINGDNIIAGAPNATVKYANQGAAYIFVRSGTSWSQQAKLVASDGAFNDYFGYSISIDGDHAIIGSVYNDAVVTNQGAAYFFVRSGNAWSQQWKISQFDRDIEDHFGYSVSISGDYAIIGAPNVDDVPFTDNGSAYIYVRSGTIWNIQAKLNAPDIENLAYFGNSVSISGDYAIVGAIYDDVGPVGDQGAAYIYRRSGTVWSLVRTVNDGNGQYSGYFGSAVGVSGFNYVIGAMGKSSSKGEVSFLNIE